MILDKYKFLNIEKIVQIFYYIQKYSKAELKLDLIKLLFFADRIHIREHFSFISLDSYLALENGPAASTSLNILNKYTDYLSNYKKEDLKFLNNITKNKEKRIIKEIQSDLLSNNEKSSIDKSIKLFSDKNLIDISHDYPEWKQYKDLFEKQIISSHAINIDDFFKNPNIDDSPALKKYFDGKDPLYKDDGYLSEAKQFYLESAVKYAT